MSSGFSLSSAASDFMRSASARATLRMRSASASARITAGPDLSLAVDPLGLRLALGFFSRDFFLGLGLKPRLLNLFLFQRKRVLHCVGFGLGLQNADLDRTLRLQAKSD